jgi:uncharacterized protein (DUF2062 family)
MRAWIPVASGPRHRDRRRKLRPAARRSLSPAVTSLYPRLAVSDSAISPEAPPPRTPWQRRIIDPIVSQLTQGITEEKIALTLAVGSALALFPILGTTTLLCLIVGIVLKLNQPIIQMVNALCTPLHLPVIFGVVRLGNRMFGVTYAHLGIRLMNQMFWDSPREFWHRFGMTAVHAIVAWAVIAPFWIVLVYFVSLPVLREIGRRRAAAAAVTEPVEPPEHPIP